MDDAGPQGRCRAAIAVSSDRRVEVVGIAMRMTASLVNHNVMTRGLLVSVVVEVPCMVGTVVRFPLARGEPRRGVVRVGGLSLNDQVPWNSTALVRTTPGELGDDLGIDELRDAAVSGGSRPLVDGVDGRVRVGFEGHIGGGGGEAVGEGRVGTPGSSGYR